MKVHLPVVKRGLAVMGEVLRSLHRGRQRSSSLLRRPHGAVIDGEEEAGWPG